MASVKLYDLAVSTGTYTDRATGQEKHRYQNIGAMMQSDKGGIFLLIEPWVNLAGVPHEPGRSILVSMFEPRKDGATSGGGSQGAGTPASKPEAQPKAAGDGFTDDIPF